METATRRLRHDRRGVSNAIVIMLSLVLVVIIVANVILWNFEMNHFDWERMQEKVEIVDIQSGGSVSPWFVAQNEYAVETGNRLSGSYADTSSTEDGSWETFQEELTPLPSQYGLLVNGTFAINIENHPISTIQTVEILLRFNASDTEEKWYLKSYNWTARAYSDGGFNNTTGNQPSAQGEWAYYAIDLSDFWRSYVGEDGIICLSFQDGPPDMPSENQTKIGIDFFGIRIKSHRASFVLRNKGPLTAHIVSLWIINSTHHERCEANLFINAGTDSTYVRTDVHLPAESFLVKIVTERGNIAVFTKR